MGIQQREGSVSHSRQEGKVKKKVVAVVHRCTAVDALRTGPEKKTLLVGRHVMTVDTVGEKQLPDLHQGRV